MPKQCKHPGCQRDVFSNNFCLAHQRYRTDEKWLKSLQKQGKNKSIKKVSDKQSKKLQEYEQAKREKREELIAENKWFCFFCGVAFKDDDSIDCHHLNKRTGIYISDKRYLCFAHTNCHVNIYHSGSYALLSSQIWYNSFLARLKEVSEPLYYKELKKGEK